MINAIIGRPRAGKSYEAVLYHIIPAAKEGRIVVTNIPVNKEAVTKFYSQSIADNIIIVKANYTDYGMQRPFSVPDDFTKYDWKNDQGQGVLFVVDEAHLCIGRDAKKEVLEYLSMHGHYGHDIILVSQTHTKLHRDAKEMVEICWRCIKKSAFGDDDHYIKKTYHSVPTRNEGYIHEEERAYEKQYFQFYQSHTQSAKPVNEAKSKDVKAQLNPYKKISIALIVVGAIFTVFLFKKMMVKDASASEQTTKTESIPEQSQPLPAQQYLPSLPSQPLPKSMPIEKKHPFYKVGLHVDSQAEYTMGGRLYRDVSFMASQNGQAMFVLKASDLRLAGYDVAVYGDCLIKVTYQDLYDDWITCDSPKLASTTPLEKQVDAVVEDVN